MNYLSSIACLIICILLFWGGYSDYLTRTIPNTVSGGILLCGLITANSWSSKIGSLLLVILSLWIAKKVTHSQSGGGDIKLYCALSFACGLWSLAVILLLTILLYHGFNIVRKVKTSKTDRFPLCSFLAPAYTVYMLGSLILLT